VRESTSPLVGNHGQTLATAPAPPTQPSAETVQPEPPDKILFQKIVGYVEANGGYEYFLSSAGVRIGRNWISLESDNRGLEELFLDAADTVLFGATARRALQRLKVHARREAERQRSPQQKIS
jgi:hypothetical protein